jgi:hypothetical protein
MPEPSATCLDFRLRRGRTYERRPTEILLTLAYRRPAPQSVTVRNLMIGVSPL